MKHTERIPGIIDFAYEIIELHEQNMALRHEVKHLKQIEEIYLDSIKSSEKHTTEMTGLILTAVLDPDSAINKGHAAIIKERG